MKAFDASSHRVSVYITSFNQKQYLVEAIESVLNQTLKPYEIIIIDDCSTDGSQEMVSEYAHRYPQLIKAIFHKNNLGIAHTRNHALKIVNGDYVTYLDGDDRFLPPKLEQEMEILIKTPEAQMAFSNFYSINSKGQRIWVWDEGQPVPQGDIFLSTFAMDFPRNIHFRNELANLRAWREVGKYDCRLKIYEDYDMRIRFTRKYQATYNREPGVEYRRHEGGLSSLKIDNHLDALEYLFEKNIPLLYDIDEKDRKWLVKKIGYNYSNMLKTNASAVIEKNPGSFMARIAALRNYFISLKYQTHLPDPRLLPRVFLPGATFRTFMNCYSRVKLKYRKF